LVFLGGVHAEIRSRAVINPRTAFDRTIAFP
jgi:hypothetical protein